MLVRIKTYNSITLIIKLTNILMLNSKDFVSVIVDMKNKQKRKSCTTFIDVSIRFYEQKIKSWKRILIVNPGIRQTILYILFFLEKHSEGNINT